MGLITVHAGDYKKGPHHHLMFGSLCMQEDGRSSPISINLSSLESVEIASEASVKRIAGTVGWGAAGAVILGPVGLLAGLLLGGKGKEVTFVARFRDGTKFLATTDAKTYTKLQAAAF